MMIKPILRLLTGCSCILTMCLGQQITIPSGTKVSCRLEQTISSATAEQGQQVQLSVTEDVKVGETVVIPQGSAVVGSVITAQEKRRMGRTGKLDFSIDKVRSVDNEFVPLRYTLNKREGGSHAVSTGVMTAGAAVLFWPAAPFFLLRKGKDITINKGIVLETFTDQDHVMKSSGGEKAGVAPKATSMVSAEASVTITSNISGADIEIDGVYVGSTPTTRPMSAGDHIVTVKSGSKKWERKLQIPPTGSISVNASFDQN